MQLYIGNKNYSSWSMRPWLLMKHTGIAFEEKRLRLDWEDDSDFKKTLFAIAPSGRVPLLVDEGFAVWDSLAIAEYLAERFPERALWPADRAARARARSICAEMHAGFGALRTHLPMNIEAVMPDIGERVLRERAEVRSDVDRLIAMWTESLDRYGGPLLFGDFGIADAYFAPVVMRMHTYGVALPPAVAGYANRMRALPGVAAWIADAMAEHDFVPFDEPYRSQA
jgi:glutathione S-transferase